MAPDQPLDACAVRDARRGMLTAARSHVVAEQLALLADGTRLRVLQALQRVPEICVGDVALAARVSDDAASYALRLLRTAGMIRRRRDGRVQFYRLSERFPRRLLTDCVDELSTVRPRPEDEEG